MPDQFFSMSMGWRLAAGHRMAPVPVWQLPYSLSREVVEVTRDHHLRVPKYSEDSSELIRHTRRGGGAPGPQAAFYATPLRRRSAEACRKGHHGRRHRREPPDREGATGVDWGDYLRVTHGAKGLPSGVEALRC